MKLRRVVLIVAGAAVIAGAATLLFFSGPTKDYRNCVALMWDRKHPAEAKRRQEEARLRQCETDRLRYGWNCDCSVRETCPDSFRSLMETPDPNVPEPNPCGDLSLEDLRRADAEASRDKPPR